MTTVTHLLGVDTDDGAAALSRGLAAALRAVPDLGVDGLRLPVDDLVDVVRELLSVPVGNLAVRAWQGERAVVAARRRTLEHPGERVVVELFHHTVTSTQEPTVDLSVEGLGRRPVLRLTLEVTLDVDALLVTVSGGRVERLSPGRASATAELSVSGATLLRRHVDVVGLRPDPPPPGVDRGPAARVPGQEVRS
ncbi:hypothetical protein [Aquipuribacter nitratireducens]|uniref:Uncharacterized protein n=1 Tax=Aquipuribacter nitratireducens TaxID=650104 RepID=A0ABW0GID5_9MICO